MDNKKIALARTVWLHIEGGEVPEELTVEGGLIARIQVTYLGSMLNANGDPSTIVCANAQPPKQQIIRIRPLQKVPRFISHLKPIASRYFSSPHYYMGLRQ